MRRSHSWMTTCGLAVSIAAILWIWQAREAPSHDQAVSTQAMTQQPPESTSPRSRLGRSASDLRHDEPRGDVPVGAPVKHSVVQPTDLPMEVQVARVEAFRGWHDGAHRRLMGCLPGWTDAGEPRAVRVYFRPETASSDATDERESSLLRASTVEPLEPDVEVPPEVRTCLDGLLGTELEVPAQAPEAQSGHQEIIHVMWG